MTIGGIVAILLAISTINVVVASLPSSNKEGGSPRLILSSSDNKLRQFDIQTSTFHELAACPNWSVLITMSVCLPTIFVQWQTSAFVGFALV
jgi:hypothetical protein